MSWQEDKAALRAEARMERAAEERDWMQTYPEQTYEEYHQQSDFDTEVARLRKALGRV